MRDRGGVRTYDMRGHALTQGWLAWVESDPYWRDEWRYVVMTRTELGAASVAFTNDWEVAAVKARSVVRPKAAERA